MNYTIEQFPSFDGFLMGVYKDLSKADKDGNTERGGNTDRDKEGNTENNKAIGKLLSNAISIGVYTSQSIIREVSVSSSKGK